MMLFHADADILFDFNVEGMEREGNAYAMSSNERSVRGQSVVVANGMGEQKKDAFLRDTWSANIIDGDDFASRLATEMRPFLKACVTKPWRSSVQGHRQLRDGISSATDLSQR